MSISDEKKAIYIATRSDGEVLFVTDDVDQAIAYMNGKEDTYCGSDIKLWFTEFGGKHIEEWKINDNI